MIKLTPELNPKPAHEAIVDAIAKALENAEFGFSLQLTRLVDGESTYTLRYSDGSEPIEFDDIDNGYAHVAEKKRLTQALAVLTTLVRFGWGVVEPTPAQSDTPFPFFVQDGVLLSRQDMVGHLRQRIERLIDSDHRVRAAEERAIAAEKAAGKDFQP